VSEQMQRIHDKIAECDREAELRGWDTSGFPRLWFAALSRVAGLDLQERRRKARHPADGSIPLPVTRDTSPGICELQQQNDELKAEIARLREERRWVPVGERLPTVQGDDVLTARGPWEDGGYSIAIGWWNGEFWMSYGSDRDMPSVAFWQPLPPGPEGDG
jgi:hypothetical protein